MSLEISSPAFRTKLKPTGMKSGVRCLQVFRSTSCTLCQRAQSDQSKMLGIIACYEPALGTFRETKKTRELTYFNREGGTYRVRVVLHRASGRLETFKCKGNKLVARASGRDFESAMVHTTLAGIEQDEQVTVDSRLVSTSRFFHSWLVAAASPWVHTPLRFLKALLSNCMHHSALGAEETVLLGLHAWDSSQSLLVAR